MKNTSLKSKISAGFSLVELLVVIAVIGVIAAIAIPNIGNITGSASTASAKRNAQNLASVYSAALAQGDVTAPTDIAGRDAIIESLTTGSIGSFSVKMDSGAAVAASVYLEPSMSYNVGGGQTAYTP